MASRFACQHVLEWHLCYLCYYRNEDGSGKGDGLVTYLKQPSVDLAIQILDGTPLRDGESQKNMTIAQVVLALLITSPRLTTQT